MSVARRASDTLFSPSPAGPPPGSGHYFLRRLSKFFLTFAKNFRQGPAKGWKALGPMALRLTIFLPSDIISLTLGGAFPAGGRKMKASI